MVGVSLSGFTLSEFLGGAPGDKTFADPHILTVSILTTAIVLVLSLLGKGLLKSFSFLIALVVGTVVAAAFGMVDFSPVASKGWLGLPTFLPTVRSHLTGRSSSVLHCLHGCRHGSSRRLSGGF